MDEWHDLQITSARQTAINHHWIVSSIKNLQGLVLATDIYHPQASDTQMPFYQEDPSWRFFAFIDYFQDYLVVQTP